MFTRVSIRLSKGWVVDEEKEENKTSVCSTHRFKCSIFLPFDLHRFDMHFFRILYVEAFVLAVSLYSVIQMQQIE